MAGSRYEGSKSRIAAMLEVLGPQPWTEYKPLVWTSSEPSFAFCLGWKAKLSVQRDAMTAERKRHLMIYRFIDSALLSKATVYSAGFRDGCRCDMICISLYMRLDLSGV